MNRRGFLFGLAALASGVSAAVKKATGFGALKLDGLPIIADESLVGTKYFISARYYALYLTDDMPSVCECFAVINRAVADQPALTKHEFRA